MCRNWNDADIDKVYQQIEKKVAQLKIKQQTTEAAICNMRSYTQQLELKVNVYDCITNVKSFVDRCNKTNTECKNLAEVRLDVVVNWEECHVGVQGVTRNISEGDIEAEGGDIKQVTPFMTQYQGHGASGIVTWRDHLMVVHYEHDMIYIYDNNMMLRNSVKVACMKSPWGLCLVQKEPKTQYLVVADSFDNCLWWLRVEEKIGQFRLGQPQKHTLGYKTNRVVSDIRGRALVSDSNSSRLYLYSQPYREEPMYSCKRRLTLGQLSVTQLAGIELVISVNWCG